MGSRVPGNGVLPGHGPRFHAWAMEDPKLAAARAPYRFVMSNPDPAWPVDLYVREDLIGLRGGSGSEGLPPPDAGP